MKGQGTRAIPGRYTTCDVTIKSYYRIKMGPVFHFFFVQRKGLYTVSSADRKSNLLVGQILLISRTAI
jgi:hypothetical protein